MIPRIPLFLLFAAGSALLVATAPGPGRAGGASRPSLDDVPSFVLLMSDDQGWGDAGYLGDPELRTPALDAMSREGVRFDRFYAGGPLCSPTRASVLTGRHPYRSGIRHSLNAVLPAEEITIAEILSARGYATGHFGKWHLGALVEGDSQWSYSPPWEHGFQVCFSTPSSLPTWDPARDAETGEPLGTVYWTGPGRAAREDLEGDASRVILDRALDFIRGAVADRRPFLAVIWFHAPHAPVKAGPLHRAMYEKAGEPRRDYWGTLTAMDEQISRLRRTLRQLGVSANTAVLFASDNGPAPGGGGSAGPLRGAKARLLEGGIRVPGLLVWPARVEPRAVGTPWSTLDVLPTLAEAAGAETPERRLDGVSLLPLLDGIAQERPGPMVFRSGYQSAVIDGPWKLYSEHPGAVWELWNLVSDLTESRNVAGENAERVESMRRIEARARTSWLESLDGVDYR